MSYATLKLLHISFVSISLLLFFLRGIAMLAQAPLPKMMRWLPHAIDTGLLISAISLAVWAGFNPVHQPWLAAKIACLLLYIALGSIALKRGKTKALRMGAWVAALLVAMYMVKLAVSKQLWF